MRGRGVLGKCGPSHAADPIVTRYDQVTGWPCGGLKWRMVVKRLRDCMRRIGGWCGKGYGIW